jgi:hypothetical protein
MATASAKLMITAEMTAAQVYREIDKVEQHQKKSTSAIAAHEQQVRRGSAFGGGQNAAYRVGLLSQQAQDVAISMQMGMSASRVIAQQGSQIASIFGPKGMVIGGVIAIGAAIAEWAFNTKKADEQAQAYKKTQEEIGEIAKRNAKQSMENIAAIEALRSGPLAGTTKMQELEFEQKLKEIEAKRADVTRNASQQRPKSGWKWRGADFDTTAREEKQALMALADEEYIAAQKINIVREEAARKRNTEADLTVIKGQQEIEILAEVSEEGKKSLKEYYDFKNKLVQIDLSDQSEINKVLLSQNEENLYYARQQAEEKKKSVALELGSPKAREEAIANEQKMQKQSETHAEKLLDISQRIARLNSEAQSSGATDARRDEIRLEVSKLEMERSSALKGASEDIVKKANEEYDLAEKMSVLTSRDSKTKLDVLKAEKDLLDKKIAWTPNEIALLNAQKRKLDEDIRKNQVEGLIAAGGAGMGIVAQQRAADRAEEKARKRAEGNLALGNIRRGFGGEIIGGVNLDPNSGKVGERVGPEEIARRQKLLGVFNKNQNLPIPAEAVFSPKQINELASAISLAVLAIQTQ